MPFLTAAREENAGQDNAGKLELGGEGSGAISMGQELADLATKGEIFSKYTYKTSGRARWAEELVIDTNWGANELVYMNDYRNDVSAGQRAALDQEQKFNVRSIEVIDTAQGKPHILYVVCAEHGVGKGEELLTDYGQGFWDSYHSHNSWCARLRVEEAKTAEATAQAKGLQRQLLAQQRKGQELERLLGWADDISTTKQKCRRLTRTVVSPPVPSPASPQ